MENAVTLKKPKSRILAIDILRGITIAGIISLTRMLRS